jgi:hypothetical protein
VGWPLDSGVSSLHESKLYGERGVSPAMLAKNPRLALDSSFHKVAWLRKPPFYDSA